jgi:hypothetical protein
VAQDLRCDNGILFGILDDGVVKVKCKSDRCGAGPGRVVIHSFDISSGVLLETRKFKDPATRREVGSNGSR